MLPTKFYFYVGSITKNYKWTWTWYSIGLVGIFEFLVLHAQIVLGNMASMRVWLGLWQSHVWAPLGPPGQN